jgi:hypothetical protein
MKKLFTTVLMACAAMIASAQEVHLTFDFTQNPWNYPTTGIAEKGWQPDYDDETGFIMDESKTFDWTIDGTDQKVEIVVIPKDYYDPEENVRPPLLYYGPNYDKDNLGNISTALLWTNPGTKVRFKAPEGWEFSKMIFWFYRNTYFVIDTEEEIEEEREGTVFKEKHKVWIPTTPKVNQNELECWQGTNSDILFDYINMKAVYEKIEMMLMPTTITGIKEIKAPAVAEQTVMLDGRRTSVLRKGIYVSNGRKIVK